MLHPQEDCNLTLNPHFLNRKLKLKLVRVNVIAMPLSKTATTHSQNAHFSEEHLEPMVTDIVNELQTSMAGLNLYKSAQVEVMKSVEKSPEPKRGVVHLLTDSIWEQQLRNIVYLRLQTYIPVAHSFVPSEHIKEPISYIRRAQVNWEKRILKSMNSMCSELNVALARKRTEKEQKDMGAKWTELGTNEPDLSKFRPVYAAKDFLDVISGLKNTNQVNCGDPSVFQSYWGIIQVPLSVKAMHELQVQFAELSLTQPQSGVDDLPDIPSEMFEYEHSRLAATLSQSGLSSPAAAQEFAKRGCPLSYRSAIWRRILGVTVEDVDFMYFDHLKSGVLQHELLVDSLFYKDVKLTATNDDQYFVFEDYLYQVLLPFSRDTSVLQHFTHSSASPAKAFVRGRYGSEEHQVFYPPNGVIPFHGFAMYAAPLCYVYNDPVVLYFVFRAMYIRYFFRLHTLSSHPQGIVSLCLQFETLVQTYEPALFLHFKSISVQPLRLAFKWLVRAFSGYLASEQVLLLWDRILAFDSLELLPILAAAIFSFRKINLMQVQTYNAAEAVLVDLLTLEVIPLIQLFMFAH